MAADAICLAAIWSIVVCGYWLVGHGLLALGVKTDIGGYTFARYLNFWPVIVAFIVCNAVAGLYHGNWMYPAAPFPPVEELRRLFATSLLTHLGVIAFLGFAYQTTDGYSRFVIAASGTGTAFAAQSFRNWMRSVLKRLGIGQISVLLAGNGEIAERIRAVLADDAFTGFRIETSVSDPREIVSEAKRRGIKILFACLDRRILRLKLDDFSRWFTYVEYIPTVESFPVFGTRAVSFNGIGGIEMVNHARMKIKRIQKRIIDMVLSGLLFLLSSPLFVIIPLLIKLTTSGPVFYRAERLGRAGKRILVWKFRSMYADADLRLKVLLDSNAKFAQEFSENFKLRDDPRITPVGRFLRRTSIDELPQIFNVFSGEMALIGPRPIVEAEVGYYGLDYPVVSSVKPGITGLWQVSGRSNTDYRRRVALDTYYVLNWSPWMDIWITIRTAYAVLLMRGAR